MLGSPFSTNRAKAVLKPSPAPSTNKASLLFWLVQFLAAKQIIGGDNLPCGFLAPSVGFWRDFQHVFKLLGPFILEENVCVFLLITKWTRIRIVGVLFGCLWGLCIFPKGLCIFLMLKIIRKLKVCVLGLWSVGSVYFPNTLLFSQLK